MSLSIKFTALMVRNCTEKSPSQGNLYFCQLPPNTVLGALRDRIKMSNVVQYKEPVEYNAICKQRIKRTICAKYFKIFRYSNRHKNSIPLSPSRQNSMNTSAKHKYARDKQSAKIIIQSGDFTLKYNGDKNKTLLQDK